MDVDGLELCTCKALGMFESEAIRTAAFWFHKAWISGRSWDTELPENEEYFI